MEYKDKLSKSRHYFQQGEQLRLQNKHKEAVKAFKDSINIVPSQPSAYAGMALCYLQLNQLDEAKEQFNLAFQMSRYSVKSPDIKYNYAIYLRTIGRIRESKTYFKDLLTGDKPFNIISFYELLMYDDMSKINDKNIRKMKALLKSPNTNRHLKIYLYFALGKLYHLQGNYKNAWLHYYRGNSLSYNKPIRDSRIDSLKKVKNSIISFFNSNRFSHANLEILRKHNKLNLFKTNNKELILILGMPRTGTTIIENILSSNDNVLGLGELEEMTRLLITEDKNEQEKKKQDNQNIKNNENDVEENKELTFIYESIQKNPKLLMDISNTYYRTILEKAKTADFIDEENVRIFLDKSLNNILFLGYILLMYPNVKIIHCERYILDTALSIYFNKFDDISKCWTTNLDNIISYYKIYKELIEHWKSIFHPTMLNVSYETLVSQPEETIKKIIGFCDFQWESKYLDFYKNKVPFFTLGSYKVREPLHTQSIGVWKKYENYIGVIISYAKHMNLL
tara:strand:- start:252 stop:1775 length:1524 start_codon:yes stop_codon:yes gene_type:complete